MKHADVVSIDSYPIHESYALRFRIIDRHAMTRSCVALEDSLKALDDIATGQLACDVILLANLNENYRPADDTTRILERKAELEIPAFVIGLGFRSMRSLGITEGVDLDITKTSTLGRAAILDVVDAIDRL